MLAVFFEYCRNIYCLRLQFRGLDDTNVTIPYETIKNAASIVISGLLSMQILLIIGIMARNKDNYYRLKPPRSHKTNSNPNCVKRIICLRI